MGEGRRLIGWGCAGRQKVLRESRKLGEVVSSLRKLGCQGRARVQARWAGRGGAGGFGGKNHVGD